MFGTVWSYGAETVTVMTPIWAMDLNGNLKVETGRFT